MGIPRKCFNQTDNLIFSWNKLQIRGPLDACIWEVNISVRQYKNLPLHFSGPSTSIQLSGNLENPSSGSSDFPA